jgi:hypothetical protein
VAVQTVEVTMIYVRILVVLAGGESARGCYFPDLFTFKKWFDLGLLLEPLDGLVLAGSASLQGRQERMFKPEDCD